mgnify:CR=1 FL=1
MKRRRLLKTISAGLSGGLALSLLPSAMSSCKEDEPRPEIDYDGVVAVIGAGAAGLYAADILKSKGLHVRIFEASDRVGGRIRSIRLFNDSAVTTDFPIELGAEKVMGSNSLWAEMIAQLTVPATDLDSSGHSCYRLENIFGSASALETDADFEAARSFLDSLRNYSGSVISVQQAIEAAGINPRVHAILNSLIGNRYGTSNERISIGALGEQLDLMERDEKELTLRSNPMQDVLASRFSTVVSSVELNTVIDGINYSGSRIILSGTKNNGDASETFSEEVDKVIVAVPVSVLRQDKIAFTPAWPEAKRTSLEMIGMDAAVRVVLDFKQNFWGADCTSIFGGSRAPELFSSGIGRSEYNKTLSLTAYGSAAQELSVAGPEALPLVLQELDEIFDGRATLNIRRDGDGKIVHEWMDWTKSPYIKGGISYLKPGGTMNNRKSLAQPLGDQIFFAGEATDVSGDSGTINGALLSAERAAGELTASIA